MYLGPRGASYYVSRDFRTEINLKLIKRTGHCCQIHLGLSLESIHQRGASYCLEMTLIKSMIGTVLARDNIFEPSLPLVILTYLLTVFVFSSVVKNSE